jgi:alkanesulfonate monooxygenase SsuD/methylene tetrahydromethanopterin reductase-like flavin-dependent oxidoreductase (luciferase family)
MDGFWDRMESAGKEKNPYHAGFAQVVCIAESDEQAKELYWPHIDYFYNRCLHVYPGFADAPGYRTNRTIKAGIRSQFEQAQANRRAAQSWEGLVENGYVVAGSPETVIAKLNELADDLNIGHLMVLLQMGDMPRETAMYNTRMFAEHVIPAMRDKFSGFEDHWYPKMMPANQRAQPIAGPQAVPAREPALIGGGGAAG